MKSLKALANKLADTDYQLEVLQREPERFVPFKDKMETIGLNPLQPTGIEIFQINVGRMCNQVCKHCHVDAGPDRKEIMTEDTMQQCLDVLAANPSLKTVDLTGGAPEMNPHFRWFVTELYKLGKKVIVRSNLTIIRANKKYYDLPEFFKAHDAEVASSLPFYTKDRTDRQRGDGVFEDSIDALKMLNDVGYGIEGSGLDLNLVYNPAGAFLPPPQETLEKEFKQSLMDNFGIQFNGLYVITNLPISRFLDFLLVSGNYEEYMEKLITAFNPAAAQGVMCRNTISIDWEGYMYDCDFNQMLNLKVNGKGKHISDFNLDELNSREIIIDQHCYGCTAGAGSSCGGQTT